MAKKNEELKDGSTTAMAVVPPAGLPATPVDLSAMLLEDQGAGTESVRLSDRAIPRLVVLQSNSPQLSKANQQKYVPGAEAGDVFDSVQTRVFKAFDKPLVVVPVAFRKYYTEWLPRDAGGGFVAEYGRDSGIEKTATEVPGTRKLRLPNGNELAEVAEFFVLFQEPESGEWEVAVISMSSTQLKHSRRWLSMIMNVRIPHPTQAGEKIQPAMFYSSYQLSTAGESNAKGDWMGWKIMPNKPVLELENGSSIYVRAREFKKSADAGTVKVQPHEAGMETEEQTPF